MSISSLIVVKLTSQRGHWAHTCEPVTSYCEPDVSSPWPQIEASPQVHSDIIQWCHKYDVTVNLWWGFYLRSWWAHTRLTVWCHRLTSVSSQWSRSDVNFTTGIYTEASDLNSVGKLIRAKKVFFWGNAKPLFVPCCEYVNIIIVCC